MGTERTCTIAGCDRSLYGHGMCQMHWKRSRRIGGLDAPVQPKDNLPHLLALASQQTDECILWDRAADSSGYPSVQADKRTKCGHRLVCWNTYGPPPFPGAQAAHACGVRRCVNPRHLRWATQVENEADKWLHGTRLTGERHAMCKLTDEQVRMIRRAYADGEATQAQLARWFGVTPSRVHAIVKGKARVYA